MGNKNSGRRPRPTVVKLLRGVQKDRINPAEPQPPSGPIVKPAELSPDAARMWDELAPICQHMGTLTAADVRPFATLCELQATLLVAAAMKGKRGLMEKAVRMERDHAGLIRPYYALFGLDPSSRARIRLPKPDEAPVSKWVGALR